MKLLTQREASKVLNVAERTLEGWRQRGTGPAFVRLSARAIRYMDEALRAWVAARVVGDDRDPSASSNTRARGRAAQ